MSEKKPPPDNREELEAVSREIQRVAVSILTATRKLDELQKEMDELQARRAELRGGQKLFTLNGIDE